MGDWLEQVRQAMARMTVPSIKITDIFDILLVAVLIYYVLVWIKETQAWAIVKGIIVVAVLCIFSYLMHFYTFTFIIEKTLSVGVIAVIILFQTEFRRGLEKLGTTGVADSFTRVLETDTEPPLTKEKLDVLLSACKAMSEQYTGALILIAQNYGDGALTETGIPINAIISKQLIMNIFVNKSPLHDGAVVIRNNRIAAASCHFPNTEKEIGRELGTRHRAAVGASEKTDAYIIVVSEETGTISLAHKGLLKRNCSTEYIKSTIFPNEDINTSKQKPRSKRTFRRKKK